MTNLLQLAQEVGKIARSAGAEILKIYETEDFGVEFKADDSPLTRADKAANAVIVSQLELLNFSAPVVSEESKEIPFAQRQHYKYFWLVDPLDGTKEFIKRNGEFTVNVALVEENRPVVGVVYVPVSDELFFAAIGEGAYKETIEHPIKANAVKLEDLGLRVVASRSHLNEATQSFMEQLNKPKIVSRGSSLKIIELAKGEADLYPRLAPTMEWDTGAAQIILEEAGGKIIDETTGNPLAYNKEVLRNNHFVAYGTVVS